MLTAADSQADALRLSGSPPLIGRIPPPPPMTQRIPDHEQNAERNGNPYNREPQPQELHRQLTYRVHVSVLHVARGNVDGVATRIMR